MRQGRAACVHGCGPYLSDSADVEHAQLQRVCHIHALAVMALVGPDAE